MVKIGQTPFEERHYRNSERPRLGIEVLALSGLRRRLTARSLAAAHRLNFHQIILLSAGSGVASIDFIDHEVRPGTLLHTRPGQVQRLPRAGEGSPPPEGVLVLFTRSFVDRPGLLAGLGTDAWNPEQPALTRIRNVVAELAAEYRNSGGREDSPDMLRHLLAVLLLHIARLPRPAGDAGGDRPVGYSQFLDALEQRFNRTRQVQDYAALLGYAPRTLTRMSLAASGRTAKEVIDARVVLEAKRLLIHTDRSIAAIAGDLGFSEPTNFVKYFTVHAGISPGAFRSSEL